MSDVRTRVKRFKIDGQWIEYIDPPIESTLTLHIKSVDTSKAIKKNPRQCAAANCAKREFKGVTDAIFLKTHNIIKFRGKKHYERRRNDARLIAQISAFDDPNGDFEPGAYICRPLTDNEIQSGYTRRSGPSGKLGGPGLLRRTIRGRLVKV